MGRVLHSNVLCTDIVHFIADEMKRSLMASIRCTRPKVSILIDESTTVSKKSCLIVYMRASVANSDPLTFFLNVTELEQTSADGITEALLKCLMDNGLDDDFLKDCFLGFCSDGASVMLGKKAGVYAKLKAKYPDIVGWHCLNHRLELSVGDAVVC